MKKCWIILFLALLLTGCGAAETFETVADDLMQPAMAPAGELTVALPESAAAQVIRSEEGERLYLCDDYVLTIHTLDSGDLEETAKTLCGFGTDSLTMIETVSEDVKRYEWVWTSAGEGGDQMGRAVVLDDGNYHYCMTVMAEAEKAGALEKEWNGVLSSVSIAP